MDKLEEIKGRLAAVAHKDSVDGSTKLRELGIDSLDIVEMFMTLEEEFEITIPDEKVVELKTVKDVIDFVKNELENK